MAFQSSENITPRETIQMQHEITMFDKSAEHAIRMQQLQIELEKIEARWTVVFKIPLAIINLPVRMILAIAFIVASARKYEPTSKLWDYLTKL